MAFHFPPMRETVISAGQLNFRFFIGVGSNTNITSSKMLATFAPKELWVEGEAEALMSEFTLTTFQPEFREDFKRLNLAWIEQYFKVEKKDLEQVNNPEQCLRAGGEIFFVVKNNRVAGTCAMYPAGRERFELAKM